MSKGCFGCRFFKAYYTKGYADFTKTDLGYCACKNETVFKSGICEEYSGKYYGKLNGTIVIRRLNGALNSLIAIASILGEEQNNK